MSVVPLIKGTTVVESREEFDAAKGRQGEKILILDLDSSQLSPGTKDESNLTYDLRVGDEYKDHRYKGKADTGKEGIWLPPNSAVIIQTLEHVYVPKFRFGYIVPKVSLLQKGISNTSSKVDPGYEGRLLVTVFNLGKKMETLHKGQKFCTIVFHEVMDRYRDDIGIYGKGEKRLEGSTYTEFFRRFFYAWRRIGITIFLAVLLLALLWFPKVREAVERRSGSISLFVAVVSLVVICIEAGLFHRIGEILKRTPPK